MLRCVALVLVLVAPLSAQVTPKQAVAQFKAAAKDELKVLKAQIKTIHGDFVDDVKALVDIYADGQAAWPDVVTSLFSRLYEVQVDLQESAHTARFETANAGLAALDALGEGGDAYPLDLYFGTGGALDDAIAAIRAAVDKELVAAGKAIKKLTKALDNTDDVVLLVQLVRPDGNDHFTMNPDDVFTWGASAITLSTVVAASSRTAAGDGVLGIAGTGYFGTLELELGGPATVSEDVEIDIASHTWAWVGDPTLAEGNYVVSARIEGDTTAAIFNLGVP